MTSVLGKVASVRICGGLGQRALGQVTAAMTVLSAPPLAAVCLEHLEGLRIAVNLYDACRCHGIPYPSFRRT